MTPPPYPLTFWSRSGQSQGQGQVSDLGWSYDKFMCCLCLYGFLEVLNSFLLFIWDTVASFLRQCKQQRAPKVASGRPAVTDAARWTWPGGVPGVMQQQEPYKSNKLYIKMMPIVHQTRWWRFHGDICHNFVAIVLLSWKKRRFRRKLTFDLPYLGQMLT